MHSLGCHAFSIAFEMSTITALLECFMLAHLLIVSGSVRCDVIFFDAELFESVKYYSFGKFCYVGEAFGWCLFYVFICDIVKFQCFFKF